MDQEKIEKAVRMILEAVGEDPDRPGLKGTPRRVARMYEEIFSGLREDPSVHLRAIFDEDHREVVLVRNISFQSTCEHHLMPFHGQAHVAYIPNGHIIGISKLARIVDSFSRRPQVQERITSQVADFLAEGLDARGVAVVVEATHTCMTMRGVKKPEAWVVTSALRGELLSSQSSRHEVLSLIRGHRPD